MIAEHVYLYDWPVALSSNGVVYYVHPDHLGSPRAVTLPATDATVWYWDSTLPFGGDQVNQNPSGLGNFSYGLRFPGQYFDSESGKHYNYFREYDATVGRYVESDPIGLRAGLNTFAYVGGNPLLKRDPMGLAESCPHPCPPEKMRQYEECVNDCNDSAMEGIHSCYNLPYALRLTCLAAYTAARHACLLGCRLRFPGCSDHYNQPPSNQPPPPF